MASSIRSKWATGSPALTSWSHFNDPFVAEMLARTGFDVCVCDMQHGNIDSSQAVGFLRGLQTVGGVTPIVRIPSIDTGEIGKMLDAGYEGIICPMVNSAADCRAFLRACFYANHHPAGSRSWGPTRAMTVGGFSLTEYHNRMGPSADTRPLTFAMIETAEAVAALEDILQEGGPHLDALFIGPMDLSLSLGEPAQGHAGKKTAEAIEKIHAACKKHNKKVGIYCGTAKAAEEFIARGFEFVVCAHDKICMQSAAKSALDLCRKAETQLGTSAKKARVKESLGAETVAY